MCDTWNASKYFPMMACKNSENFGLQNVCWLFHLHESYINLPSYAADNSWFDPMVFTILNQCINMDFHVHWQAPIYILRLFSTEQKSLHPLRMILIFHILSIPILPQMKNRLLPNDNFHHLGCKITTTTTPLLKYIFVTDATFQWLTTWERF